MRSVRFVVFFLLVILSSTTLAAQICSAYNPDPLAARNGSSASLETGPKIQDRILESYGNLPLSFETNRGQTDAQVKFFSRASGYTLFLTDDAAIFSVTGEQAGRDLDDAFPPDSQLRPATLPAASAVLQMKLVEANSAAQVSGEDQLPGKSNYFIGNDPTKWRSRVPTYAKVKYAGVYSGVDLVYYGNQRQLEYDFIVAPGADPHRIQFEVRGARSVRQDPHGDLVLDLGDGEVRWRKPVVYQKKDGIRQEIAADYVINDKGRVGFEVADYDPGRPLFIDPLVYSTYLGGSLCNQGLAIAADSSGNAYVTGITSSTNFPTMNPLQPANAGNSDVFVTKINPTGSALVYSTYLGGGGDDWGRGIAVDSSGNAYVTGATSSGNFPTMNPLQPAYGGGYRDAFVLELDASGSALVYSTFLGGNDDDHGYGIAVDASGAAYVAGGTYSTNFPTMNPVQPAYGGNADAFVAKLNPGGSAFTYSTYLGGDWQDWGVGIAVDNSGNAYVTGETFSYNFPTLNPLQPTIGGYFDAFVSVLNPSGSAFVYSTYLGGNGFDIGHGIAVDSSGNAYVVGATASSNFPTLNPLQPSPNGGYFDAFVSVLNPSGSAFVYSTYLGGSGYEQGYGIAVDSSGNAYVTGQTSSGDFPTMNPLQLSNAGSFDAFVSELNPSGSAFVYSTYLGGKGADWGYGIAVDSSGNAYINGITRSANFPTINPLQSKLSGDPDGWVVKIAQPSPFGMLVPSNLDFGNQTEGITSAPQHSTFTNRGEFTLTIVSILVTGPNSSDFAESNNCGNSLPPRGTCQISVRFTPPATGARAAAVTITDNAPDSPQTLPLSGTGTLPAVTLSPPSPTFAGQVIGTTSQPQAVQLSASGAISITSIAASADFGQTNNCGKGLPVGGKCQISLTFTPKASGPRNGTLTITDSGADSPQTAPLSGTGQDFSLAVSSPTSMTITAGQAANYSVVVSPLDGFNQVVTLSCSGIPAQSTCSVSPASVVLDGSHPAKVDLAVVTRRVSAGLAQPVGAPPGNNRFAFWVAFGGVLGLALSMRVGRRHGKRRSPLLCALTLLCLLSIGVAMPACGGKGGAGTPAGTYTPAVTGTFASSSAKLTHTIEVTLIVAQ